MADFFVIDRRGFLAFCIIQCYNLCNKKVSYGIATKAGAVEKNETSDLLQSMTERILG